jgi:hypothetical protein
MWKVGVHSPAFFISTQILGPEKDINIILTNTKSVENIDQNTALVGE